MVAANAKQKRSAKKTTRIGRAVQTIKRRKDAFLARRPHRSFRLTKRRDYTRSLKLPGYLAFTAHVFRTMWQNKKSFAGIGLTYIFLLFILTTVISEDTYQAISTTVNGATQEVAGDFLGPVGSAFVTLLSTVNNIASPGAQDSEQRYNIIIGILVALLIWLTTIWLLRNRLAGHVVKVRDALYNAGAPIVATFVIVIVMAVQLLPAALGIIVFLTASSTGILDNGAIAMGISLVGLLFLTLSIYWITASFIALVVATLPGMYPLKALSIAGDMVVGRRVRILMRLGWLLLTIIMAWFVVMLPFILFDTWLKQDLGVAQGIPIIPALIIIMATLTLIWSASYVYLLYRKVVDDDALPA